jgi:hypothetical protein
MQKGGALCGDIDVSKSKHVAVITQKSLQAICNIAIDGSSRSIPNGEDGLIGIDDMILDMKLVPSSALEAVACLYAMLILATMSHDDEVRKHALAMAKKLAIGPAAMR